MEDLFRVTIEGVTFGVKVVPRAKRDEVVGIENEVVKIRLSAPPVEGRANEALVRFLAERLGVALGSVEIVKGETGRNKVVKVKGIGVERLRQGLGV